MHLMMAVVTRIMPPLVWFISLFIPKRDSSIEWREAKNKAEIMQLVEDVTKLTPPKGSSLPLRRLVDRCYALGEFPALWAVEGMGHYYGETCYERQQAARDLLGTEPGDPLPDKSMTMLHAGIGLAFAKHNLDGLKANRPSREIRAAAEKFLTLCRESSRPGYRGAAVESLGLVSRFLHGHEMVLIVDRLLMEIDPEAAGYFWHGVGRATYFSPPNFFPGFAHPVRAVDMCRQEAPHELGQRNMLAGLAWAITLVNMRHPEIMATILKANEKELSKDDAFYNGVASSVVMRYDTTPGASFISDFYEYQPDAAVKAAWERQVKTPCEFAVNELYPLLKQRSRLEEVFHYQDLAQLATQLRTRSA